MEIMITMVIMAVLAGLALPAYFKTIEQSRSSEARTNLSVIHMGQKIYRLNNASYFGGDGSPTIAELNTGLNVDMTAVHYTNVSALAISTGTAYTVQLTRNNVDGGNSSKWFRHEFTTGNTAPTFTEGGAY